MRGGGVGGGLEGLGEHEGVGGHRGPRRPLAWDLGKNLPSVTLCDTLAGSHEGFSRCSFAAAAAAAPISQRHISSRGSAAYSSHPSLGVFSLGFFVALAQSRKQVVGRVDVCRGLSWIIADKVLWEHSVGVLAGGLTAATWGFIIFFHSSGGCCAFTLMYIKSGVSPSLCSKSDRLYFLQVGRVSQVCFSSSFFLWLF